MLNVECSMFLEGRAPSRPLQKSATTERGPPLSGLFKTVAAMIAPCSVKAKGLYLMDR